MPYFWEGQVVVTKEELVPRFYASWETLRRKLSRDADKPYGIRRARRGGGKACTLLIDFDSLPPRMKAALGDPRNTRHVLEEYIEPDREAVRYFATLRPGKSGGIKPERQAQLVRDAEMLRAAMALLAARRTARTIKGIPLTGIERTVCEDLVSYNAMLEETEARTGVKMLRHTLPTNYRRLMEKIERFKEEGYASLLKNYNNRSAVVLTERTQRLLNALFIQKQKPTPTEVARQYAGFLDGYVDVIDPQTGEVYDPKEFRKISERTIRAFLASWKQRVATHLTRAADRQKYIGRYLPSQEFRKPEFAGEILSIDDRQPPFEYEKGARMWFYNGIDLASEAIIAFVWGKSKEGIIRSFYQELVRNCAEWGVSLPYEVECESSLNASFRDTILREGNLFEKVRIIPNVARSKRIEGYNAQLRYNYEKEDEGWIGRPFARNEAYATNPEHRQLIPYDTLVRRCLEHIRTWNNTPHSTVPGKTRWEVFLERQHPDLKPINWHGILPHLGERTLSSCRAGTIRLNGAAYLLGDEGRISTGERLLELMEQVEGKEVEIRWLRGHDGGVLKALVYRGGRCLCEAVRRPVAERGELGRRRNPGAAANFELVERYKATIAGWARSHKNEIDRVAVIDNRPRTLNDKFQIPWLDAEPKPAPRTEDYRAQTLPQEESELRLNAVRTAAGREMCDLY